MFGSKSVYASACLMLVLGMVGGGCNFKFSTASIKKATMSKKTDENKKPVDETTAFSPEDKKVYCCVEVANAPDDTKVKAKWYQVNLKGEEKTKFIDEAEVTGGGNIAFSLSFENGIPPGDYEARIFLNPDSDKKDEKPAKTLTFKSKAAVPDVKITDIKMALDEKGDRTVTAFPAGTKALYCFVSVEGAKEGLNLYAGWVTVNVPGQGKNEQVKKTKYTLTSPQDTVRYSLTLESGFSPGDYRVDIYAEDSDTPLKSLNFPVLSEDE